MGVSILEKMHRNAVLSLLKKYRSNFLEEAMYKDQIIAFIKKHNNCFDRDLSIGHITGSCWLLNKDCSKALLMHHRKLNKWLQLGGHADGESDILQVAIKEAQEESGVDFIIPIDQNIFDIDVHFIPGNDKEKEHFHYDIRFLLRIDSDEKIKPNFESKEMRWFSFDELLQTMQEKSILRMCKKWQNINFNENNSPN